MKATRQRIKITRGLDLPIEGAPEQRIEAAPAVKTVALLGDDYFGMRPTMAVKVGDRVKLGELLFEDKKTAGVRYTSPACGTVAAIHRGAKRALEAVVIDVEGADEESFEEHTRTGVEYMTREQVRDALVASGLWTALRTRPFSKVPSPESTPHALFVTAIDTNPLAPRPETRIRDAEADFLNGVRALATLTDGATFVCTAPESGIDAPEGEKIVAAEFEGPHPAGLAGTHIHFLAPVSRARVAWYVGYQDAIAIGRLLTTGRLSTERVIALGGPRVRSPRLIRTRLGASTDELTRGELKDGDSRVISGSVFAGHHASGAHAFLGRYHQQLSVLAEGRERVFLGWLTPGPNKFSIKNSFVSSLNAGKKFAFTTSLEGSRRAMVPIGMYEKVMPLDILPTFLLRALIVEDTEQAQALGCLELDEEDLGLCTFVCTGKYDYGPLLRRNLTTIERDG